MGILGKLFKKEQGGNAPAATTPGGTGVPRTSSGNASGGRVEMKPAMNGSSSAPVSNTAPLAATAGVADQASALRDALQKAAEPETAEVEMPAPRPNPAAPVVVRGGESDDADIKAPRNKQELFEELQKNYREVVSLIRKVDNHLDEQHRRSARVAEIAERLDGLSGSIQQAGMVPERIDDLKDTIQNALETTEKGTAERTERVRVAVEQVGEALVASSDQQSKLTHTMAEFRQTIGDLSDATGQSSDAMRTLMDSVVERDKALAEELRATRSRVIVAVGAIGVVALAAVVVAIVALTQA